MILLQFLHSSPSCASLPLLLFLAQHDPIGLTLAVADNSAYHILIFVPLTQFVAHGEAFFHQQWESPQVSAVSGRTRQEAALPLQFL